MALLSDTDPDQTPRSTLADAVMHRQMACLNLLLEAGANLYPTWPVLFPRYKFFGPSPLDMAIRTRWEEGVKAMLNTLSTKLPQELVRLRQRLPEKQLRGCLRARDPDLLNVIRLLINFLYGWILHGLMKFLFFFLYSWILHYLIIFFNACQIFVEVNSYDVYKLIFSIDESYTV